MNILAVAIIFVLLLCAVGVLFWLYQGYRTVPRTTPDYQYWESVVSMCEDVAVNSIYAEYTYSPEIFQGKPEGRVPLASFPDLDARMLAAYQRYLWNTAKTIDSHPD